MDQHLTRVVLALCEDLNTPRSLTVYMMVKHGELRQLLELAAPNPSSYVNDDSYWRDAVATELLRKSQLMVDGIDRRGAAVATFWSCEAQNAATNARLAPYLGGNTPDMEPATLGVARFIDEWRKEVKRVLGSIPLEIRLRFSGGATVGDVGGLTTLPDKLSSSGTVYSHSQEVIDPFWVRTSWYRGLVADRRRTAPRVVRGNTFFTVPKSGKTDRGCCKEASLNVAAQLSVGRDIRDRLLRLGIDLRKGKDQHMALARQGSVTGSLATIDLSNASDTIARNLVKLILPEDWFTLLDSLRSPFTKIDKSWVRLEKFSSMGNGFTFELETLLFATLARTVSRLRGVSPDVVTCFGDDIILDSDAASDLLAVLPFFGFAANAKKSFVDGPFRESCGGDFFMGRDVRAAYLEELPDEPHKWIALANSLRRICKGDPFRWRRVRRAWHRCLAPLPRHIRALRGPVHLGDIVIHDRYVTTDPPTWADLTWENSWVKAWCPIPITVQWKHWTANVQLACCTLGVDSSGVTPRGGISGYAVRKVNILRGSWVP